VGDTEALEMIAVAKRTGDTSPSDNGSREEPSRGHNDVGVRIVLEESLGGILKNIYLWEIAECVTAVNVKDESNALSVFVPSSPNQST
jgi:hypothetical protein